MSVLDTLVSGTDTDRKIYEGALSCLARFGVAKTQLQDIVEAAGVSRTTLYSWTPPDRKAVEAPDRVHAVLMWACRAGAESLAESLKRDISHEVDPRERLVLGITKAIAALDECTAFQHVLRYEPETLWRLLDGAFDAFYDRIGFFIAACTEAVLREEGTPSGSTTVEHASRGLVGVVGRYVLAGERNSLRDRPEVERILDRHFAKAAGTADFS